MKVDVKYFSLFGSYYFVGIAWDTFSWILVIHLTVTFNLDSISSFLLSIYLKYDQIQPIVSTKRAYM